MRIPLLQGRSPAQILAIGLHRAAKAGRRLILRRRRRLIPDEELACTQPSSHLRWVLTEAEARRILQRHPESHLQILEEAQLVVSGWAEVPGFGRRHLEMMPGAALSEAEAYGRRLLLRLDFLRPLSRAALIASDPSHFIGVLQKYLAEFGRAYAQQKCWDTVDESIRILNITESLSLLKQYLTPQAYSDGIKAILNAAWNVETNRARTGNHLIYEGLALLAAGYALPDHPRASHWFALGRRILEEQMTCQVLSDGFNAELCTNYHLITGVNFLKGWILARKAGQELSVAYAQRLGKTASVAVRLQTADGSFLALGDSDRMAGPSREEREARAFAAWQSRTVLADLELDWLLAAAEPGLLAPADPCQAEGMDQRGGYCFWRGPQGLRLIFDAGSFGLPGASHHGHADSLSFELHLKDNPFLIDPGGFSYVDPAARAYARSTGAHNTIRLDGRNSSEITGSFSFGRGAEARCLKAERIEGGCLLVGQHDGYSPTIHRRAMFWLPEPTLHLVVVDRLLGSGFHQVEAFIHADAGWDAQLDANGRMLWSKEEHQILQWFWCNADCEMAIIKGQLNPEWQGWVSPTFGVYCEAPVVIIASRSELPLLLVSAFGELAGAAMNIPPNASGRRIQFPDGRTIDWDWSGEMPTFAVN